MKTASSLKQEVSNLRTALREKATAADTATEKLTLAELSWDKQKKFLQDEIELTKARYEIFSYGHPNSEAVDQGVVTSSHKEKLFISIWSPWKIKLRA